MLQAVGQDVGYGNHAAGEKGQAPVVDEEHDEIDYEGDARVEDFGRKFPHPLRAGIDVGYGLGHEVAQIFPAQLVAAHVHQGMVQRVAHDPADLGGKNAYAVALAGAHGLDQAEDDDVGCSDFYHIHRDCVVAQNIVETLGHEAFEVWAGAEAEVVEEARHGNDTENGQLPFKIGKNAVRMIDLALCNSYHGNQLLRLPLPYQARTAKYARTG